MYTLVMSRVFIDVSIECAMPNYQAILYTVIPICVILFTSYMVLFSKDGLLNNLKVQERLVYFTQQTQEIQEKSNLLQTQIRNLKTQQLSVISETSTRAFAAPKGSVIYVFDE